MIVSSLIDMLRTEEEVYVNQLGLFSKEFHPAKVSKTSVAPPHYSVVLDSLAEGSGFAFILHYSNLHKTKITDADEAISHWTEELTEQLRRDKSVTVPSFGIFTLKKGIISFESEIIPALNTEFEGMEEIPLKEPDAEQSSTSATPIVAAPVLPEEPEPIPEPVLSDEPEQPAEPAEPEDLEPIAAPVLSEEPVQVEVPVASVEPEQPEEPAEPEDLEPVAAPVLPEEPEPIPEPVLSEEPVQVEVPVASDEPEQPAEPAEPEDSEPIPESVLSEEPEQVEVPVASDEPEQPAEPAEPEDSEPIPESVLSEEPEPIPEPVLSEEPVQVEVPVASDEPEQPEEPVTSEDLEPIAAPVLSEEPVQVEVPVTSDEPAQVEVPVASDEPEQPAEPAEPEEPEEKKKRKRSRAWIWILLIVVLLAAAGVAGYLYRAQISEFLQPYLEKIPGWPKTEQPVPAPASQPEEPAAVVPAPDTIVADTLLNEEDTLLTESVEPEPQPEPFDINNMRHITFEPGKYYVIQGSFGSDADCAKHVKHLALQKYNPTILYTSGDWHRRVCLGVFTNETEAERFAAGIHNAWVKSE